MSAARTRSTNPPGDTRAAVQTLCRFLAGREGISVHTAALDPTRVNVVAVLRGRRPARRLVFNGHLDTGPVPEPERWSVSPFAGMIRDRRIYGRGVSDTKAGVAAQAAALAALAPLAPGELVLTAVADGGSGGSCTEGSANSREASGVMVCG
jgi:succinyl-diaminopimelate desuccinylase